jgi:hypothetical protein
LISLLHSLLSGLLPELVFHVMNQSSVASMLR